MGSLQPGLPRSVAIPKDYHMVVIDLKDCFFTIPLHPEDSYKFAFSVPSINFRELHQRYQWVMSERLVYYRFSGFNWAKK